MPATIRDIKNRTGLSLATISKYINGGNVLPENKVKIEKAIKELHYEVNEIARSMITNKTNTVGVCMYSVESPFSGQIMHHISESLRKYGYGLLICDSCNDPELEAANIKYLVSKKVDGIIVLPQSDTSEFLAPALDSNTPIVLVDRALSDASFDCVKIDNQMAVFRAMDAIISNNHKKIAIIASDSEYTGKERYLGFMNAMSRAKISVPKKYIKFGNHTVSTGYKCMKELLELPDRPTAVFADNYETTLGAIMAINETGLKCPDEISILGFDDEVIFHLTEPTIYTVSQPISQMSSKAVEILMDRIANGVTQTPMEISLHTAFHEGKSIKKL